MNQVNLIGRMTKDPEIREDKNNNAYLLFSLAVNKPFNNKETGKPDVSFIDVFAGGKAAELIAKYVTKGQMLGVTGWLDMSSYQKDGVWHKNASVRLDRFYFLGGRQDSKKESYEEDYVEMEDDPNVELPFDL